MRGLPGAEANRNDVVVGLVERWADQIVHGGIGNDEGLLAVALHLQDTRDERPGLGHEETPGLEEEPAFEAAQACSTAAAYSATLAVASNGPPW
jgi:hypothetical protein